MATIGSLVAVRGGRVWQAKRYVILLMMKNDMLFRFSICAVSFSSFQNDTLLYV